MKTPNLDREIETYKIHKKQGYLTKDGENYLAEFKAIKQALTIHIVSNSALLEELRLKLIGMECFANEYYNEDAKAGCKTIFDELKDWIDKKRV